MERTFSLDTRGVLEHCQTSKMDCLNNSAKIFDRVLNTALDTSQNNIIIIKRSTYTNECLNKHTVIKYDTATQQSWTEVQD